MRVLICCNIYPPHFIGGAELVAHYQGKQLAASGHEVRVFTGDTQAIGHRHALRTETYDGLTVHRVHLSGIDYPSEYVNFSHPQVEAHFSGVLAEFCPDVVHCHNIIGLSVSILQIAREFGARVLLTLHDHWAFCFKNTIMKTDGVACADYARCEECMPFIGDGCGRRIPMRMRQDFMKLAMEAVDAFVSPSQYLANTYIEAGFDPLKMNVIWNGIDVDKFAATVRTPGQGRLRFSFFGYFGRHKGIHTLLAALPLLKNPNRVQINLIGDGDQRSAYEQQLLENRCADSVKFWGKLANHDVTLAYAQTDVLVLPSIWRENQPVSITEAMAYGIPVIGSNMGGIPELVEDGASGLIFEAGNAVDLAEKMERLIANPSLITAMGLAGQQKMQDNSFARQVEKLLQLYRVKDNESLHEKRDVCVLACLGHRVNLACAEAMDRLPDFLIGNQPYVLMADWLTQYQLKEASLVWVVDDTASSDLVEHVCRYGLPLLIPESNVDLLRVCQESQCGLYYQDADDAAACIAYLLTHEQVREDMARNAQIASLNCAS